MSPSETFVFDGIEVIKTGRTAVREIKSIGGRPGRQLTMVEIKPLDPEMEWRKWVDPAHLYVIQKPAE